MSILEPTAGRNDAPLENISDEVLMGQVCLGQATAFEEIVRRYQNKLLDHTYRQIRNKDIAEDVVQETFTAVWEKRYGFNKNIAKFSTWVYNILTNQINMALRARYREKGNVSLALVPEDKDGLAMTGSLSSGLENLSRSKLTKLREAALKALDDEERTLYQMKEVDGLSYAEIAERAPFIGMKPDALMKRRQRYKDKLIKLLTREGIIK